MAHEFDPCEAPAEGKLDKWGFTIKPTITRMYGVNKVRNSPDITRFCTKWAKTEEQHPLGSLTSIDFYFRDNWEVWGEYV
jgi:hypothetical protein